MRVVGEMVEVDLDLGDLDGDGDDVVGLDDAWLQSDRCCCSRSFDSCLLHSSI